jgi:DNA polymerase-3 subunit alpha
MALARAQRAKRDRLQGQNGLFQDVAQNDHHERVAPAAKPWIHSQLLAAEKAALGFYITGHPLGDYLDLLESLNAAKSLKLSSSVGGERVSIGGIISDLQLRTTKKGDKFALLRLDDEHGSIKCVLWPETYRKHSALLENELAALVTGRLELNEDSPPTLIVETVQSLSELLKNGDLVVLRVPQLDDSADLFDKILHLLNRHQGSCEVALETLIDPVTLVRVKVNSALRVERSGKLDSELAELGCSMRVEKPRQSSENAGI